MYNQNYIEQIYDELVEDFGQPVINRLIRDFYAENINKQGLL